MYIKAYVVAGARKESCVKESDGTFHIGVQEKPERNQANTRVRELLAEHFHVPLGRVRIVNGHYSPSKLISVDTE